MPRYIGALHVHSTLSDGRLTPEQIREKAIAEGLDFVVLAEHARYLWPARLSAALEVCRRLSSDEFLLALGLEVERGGYHALVLCEGDGLERGDVERVVDEPGSVREIGGMVIWAHPAGTYAWTLRAGIGREYDGWEVWSGLADGAVPSLPMLRVFLEQLASGRRQLIAVGGTDFHGGGRRFSPLLEVEMDWLDVGCLIRALRSKRYRVVARVGEGPEMSAEGEVDGLPFYAKPYSAARFALLRVRAALKLILGFLWHATHRTHKQEIS